MRPDARSPRPLTAPIRRSGARKLRFASHAAAPSAATLADERRQDMVRDLGEMHIGSRKRLV